jgi:hypothetical protein
MVFFSPATSKVAPPGERPFPILVIVNPCKVFPMPVTIISEVWMGNLSRSRNWVSISSSTPSKMKILLSPLKFRY